MKKISALVLAASLAGTAAYAGGPVVAPAAPQPAMAKPMAPTSSFPAALVVPLLLLVAIAVK